MKVNKPLPIHKNRIIKVLPWLHYANTNYWKYMFISSHMHNYNPNEQCLLLWKFSDAKNGKYSSPEHILHRHPLNY